MKYDFIIFGGTGRQGSICAKDLLEKGYSTLLVGRNPSSIKSLLKSKKAGFMKVDLRDQSLIEKAIHQSGADIVINCAELTFNVAIMKACLKEKRSCTDLGGLQYVTQEQFKLHQDFKKEGIICITGCGSTPGIANVMTAHVVHNLDKVKTIDLGFAWNSNIKKFVVPYSIESIFDELTESPVLYHNGKFVKSNRMTCMGTFNFKAVGKQTTYCIVHSEVYTFSRYFRDKGIKDIHYYAGFPDHSINKIRTMMKLNLNSKKEQEIEGISIRPLDFTRRVLNKIKIPKGYKEIENLWVKVEGEKSGIKKNIEMNCIVKTIKGWEEAGTNIDTGRTISIISQMLKSHEVKESGVYAPEAVIPCKPFFKELAKRKMYVYMNGKKIN